VSRAYLDTNFLYGVLRQPEQATAPAFRAWRGRLEEETAGEAVLISALVIDELVYRLVLAWLKDGGDTDPLSTFRQSTVEVMGRMRTRLSQLWEALVTLPVLMVDTDSAVIRRAMALMADPGLGPRDAFHAAHAVETGCEWIVSSDVSFDLLSTPRRLGPTTP